MQFQIVLININFDNFCVLLVMNERSLRFASPVIPGFSKNCPDLKVNFLYKVRLTSYTKIKFLLVGIFTPVFLLACERVFTGFFFILSSTSTCSTYFVWCLRRPISTSPNCTRFERNGRTSTARIAHIAAAKAARIT